MSLLMMQRTRSGVTPEPPPAPEAWYEEQWDYASTAALEAAMSFVFETNGNVTLNTSAGSGAETTSGNAMRATMTSAGECTVGVTILPSDYATEQAREVWIEQYIRFSDTWDIASDDKTLFYLEDQSGVETARWELHIVSSTFWYGAPSGALGNGLSDFIRWEGEGGAVDAWDGNWHRLRIRQKMGTTNMTTDGAYQVWWDDRLLISNTAFRTNSPATAFFRNISLGQNCDPGNGTFRDWGRLRIYTTDPGWT